MAFPQEIIAAQSGEARDQADKIRDQEFANDEVRKHSGKSSNAAAALYAGSHGSGYPYQNPTSSYMKIIMG